MIEKINFIRRVYNIDRVNEWKADSLEERLKDYTKTNTNDNPKLTCTTINLRLTWTLLSTGVLWGEKIYKLDNKVENYLIQKEIKSRLKKYAKKKKLTVNQAQKQFDYER